MQNQSHLGTRTILAWSLLVVLLLTQQVSAGPIPSVDVQPSSVQGQAVKTLRRTARMTPLWRIMGTKPYGAYCHNHYECSTGICRGGHCVFNKPTKS